MALKDMSGKRYGRLKVIARDDNAPDGTARWVCLCDCGNKKTIKGSDLRRCTDYLSCGCLRKEMSVKHSMSRSSEYKSWQAMKYRCLNPNCKSYKDYGGRGITIHQKWVDDFKNFLFDMGRKPSPDFSIERINNDEGYYPWNCRWADRRSQSNNRRSSKKVEIDGVEKSYAEWARVAGITTEAFSARMKAGKKGGELIKYNTRKKAP